MGLKPARHWPEPQAMAGGREKGKTKIIRPIGQIGQINLIRQIRFY
jgi:hypothetical protein